MELIDFQERASSQIAKRFFEYSTNPLMVDRTTTIPFLQTLVAITGSGKTLMLADAVSQMRDGLGVAPVVLWISKGRVVVSQTFENLSSGKYADNLSGFNIVPLLEVAPDHLSSADSRRIAIPRRKRSKQRFVSTDTKHFDLRYLGSPINGTLWDRCRGAGHKHSALVSMMQVLAGLPD